MGSILQNKKDYPSIVSFLRRWRDLNCPPRNIVVHFPSLRSVVALLISRSFGLPPPATGSGRPLLPRHCGAKVCPNKKTWRKWNSWKTADTRKFPAGILWLRLSRGTDAVAVAFSISECKVSYPGAPFEAAFLFGYPQILQKKMPRPIRNQPRHLLLL